MRFLHTGDWHVGKAIRGRSRMDEFEKALDQVVEIAVDQRVDAVLHAGDLYEHRTAAPDADALVFETLLRLHAAGIPVVGDPREPRLLAAARGVRRAAEGGERRHGGEGAAAGRGRDRRGRRPATGPRPCWWRACRSFPERRFASSVELFDSTEAWFQSYAEGMGLLLDAMAEGSGRTR